MSEDQEVIVEESEAFKDWLEENTGVSGGTPDMYAAYIKRLDEPLRLDKYGLEEAVSILQDAVRTGPVRAAFKKYLQYLKSTQDLSIDQMRDVAFLQDELDDIELDEGKPLTKSEVLRKYLRRSEIQELMDYINSDLGPSDFDGDEWRYDEFRVLPILLFETGCRIGEVIGKQNDPEGTGLRLADVDFDDNKVRIRNAKGGKDRIVHFNDAAPLLEEFVEKYGIESGKLFYIPYWKQNYEFKKAGKQLFGFPGPAEPTGKNEYRLTAHWMRHSFATNWVIKQYKKTGRWAEAKERVHEYLDHDQMATTEAYIGAAKELEQDNIYDEEGGFDIDVGIE